MANDLIKKKILFITFGRSSVPSVYFRLMIHREILENHFEIDFSESFSFLWRQLLIQPHVIFIQKKQLPLMYWFLIKLFFKSKVIYDFDDAIDLAPRKEWGLITRIKINFRFFLVCQLADMILCPNAYLANRAVKTSSRAHILPMCAPSVSSVEVINGPIYFGWAGHPQSIHLLRSIETDIREFQAVTNNRNFLILCGEDPQMNFSYEWLPYSKENQHLFFSRVHVGLAPSRNTPFDMGKSPIKIIQHFSYGRTILTNMRGGAEDMVTQQNGFLVDSAIDQSWFKQLTLINNSPELVRIKSDQALNDFSKNYDSRIVGEKFVQLIQSILV
jgi:hypothetical protein